MRALLLVLVGCATSPHGTTCMDLRGGRCCDGLGCASGVGPLTATVVDSTNQQPIAGTITFTSPIYNGPMPATCTAMTSPCPSWQVDGATALGEGSRDITAAAAGYTATTFTVVLEGPVGCCGQGPPVSATVAMNPMI